MKLRYLLFALGSSCWAASFTASVTGPWSSSATWGGAGVPGNGDVASVNDSVTVTVTDARIIGSSSVVGVAAIQFNTSGAVIIASGGSLQIRGDLTYPCGFLATTAYMTVQGGGVFEWDAHLASPTSTTYSAYSTCNPGYRQFVTTGTSGNRAIVRSNAGGGNGYFKNPSAVGGSFTLTYTDFLRIGNATNSAFFVWSDNGTNNPKWSSTYNTFTNCGEILGNGSMFATETFQHDFNVHIGSVGASAISRIGDLSAVQALATGGVRELIGNVFDIIVGDSTFAFDCRDFTVHSNYFGGDYNTGGPQEPFHTVNSQAYAWRYFQNNFVRQPVAASQIMVMMGDARDNIFLLDQPSVVNPHGINYTTFSPQTFFGDIIDHFGFISASVSAWTINTASALSSGTSVLANNILLPNAAGHQSWWLSVWWYAAGETSLFWATHNTAIIDSDAALVADHPGQTVPDPVNSLVETSNILWNPVNSSLQYKLLDGANIEVDVCAPTACDYNVGFNMKTDGGGFSGGANGYANKFTAGTPGTHDLAVNPQFFDSTRNVATFDFYYLKRTAIGWNSGATYAVGDIVVSRDPTIYGSAAIGFPSTGAFINYRYTNGTWNGTNCSGANPQPGIMSAGFAISRACWELNTLNDLRLAIGYSATGSCPGTGIRDSASGQCLYDDQTIGVHGVDLITVLIQWIRSGYSPTNQALAFAGADGLDIGAVPVTYAPASFLSTQQGITMREGTLRGKGIIR